MRLRQIALVANELEPAVDDLCAVLGLQVTFRDPGVKVFGLHNALLPVGDTFLEVVSPIEPGTSAGRLLERRGGDGGYMAIFQSRDLAADRARLERLGVRIVWETALEDIATVHLHPRDVGAAIVSIDEAHPPASWRWAGPRWAQDRRSEVVSIIAGAEIEAHDPDAMSRRWAEVLALDVQSGDDGPEIGLDGGVVRFVAAGSRGEGLGGIELAAADADRARETARERGLGVSGDTIEICGTRLRLV